MNDMGPVSAEMERELDVDICETPYGDLAMERESLLASERCVHDEDEDDYGVEFDFDDDDEDEDDADEYDDEAEEEEDDLDEELD